MPFINQQPIGKFKKLLREKPYLQSELEFLKPYLNFLHSSYFKKIYKPSELITLFLILYQYSRIKVIPFQKNPISFPINISLQNEFPIEFDFINTLNLETNKILDFLKYYSFRFLPNSIREVLLMASLEEDKLVVRIDIPSSIEMLSLQSNGSRYITIDFESASNGNFIDDKRDAFEFVLHDLEHAYCFFKKEYDYERQIDFFSSIQRNYHMLKPILNESDEFRKDFEYCISDMNSHPEHLIQYLKAILVKYFLVKNNKSEKSYLSSDEQIPMNEIMNAIQKDFLLVDSKNKI